MLEEINTVESFNGNIEEQGVKIAFIPSKRKKTKKINVIIEGVFTLSNAAFVMEKISPSFKDFDSIDIVLKNIQQIDLAAVQVLQHLKKAEAANNKSITLDAELSKEDRALLFNSGLMALLTKTKLTD